MTKQPEQSSLRCYVQFKVDIWHQKIQPLDRKSTPKERHDALVDAAVTLEREKEILLPWDADEGDDNSTVEVVQIWLDKIWQKHLLLHLSAEETRWADTVTFFDAWNEWGSGPEKGDRYTPLSKAMADLSKLGYVQVWMTGSDNYYKLNEMGLAAQKVLLNGPAKEE